MAKRELKGIDGWLLVFMAALLLTAVAHAVLFGIGQQKMAALSDRYGPLPWPIAVAGWVYHAARIAIPLIIFWRMLRVPRWGSVVFTIAGLWLLFVGVELADYLYAVLTTPESDPGMQVELIRTLLGKGFIALSGTAYLLASTRVANTYPRGGSPELIAQDFE